MSSSVILTKQLEKESAELKKYIGDYLEEKVKEFTENLQDKIGQFVNRRILSFYHGPSHDMSLFDQDGETILKGVEDAFSKRNWTQLLQEYQFCLKQKNRRCFHIQVNESAYFFFGQCVIVTGPQYLYPCSDDSGQRFSVMTHSLNHDMLRTLKHFQLARPGNLEQGLSLYRVHPEFFHSKCTEFEEMCSLEHHEIREKKKQLELERKQLADEKKQWSVVKQNLTRMRLELARERLELQGHLARFKVDDLSSLEEVD